MPGKSGGADQVLSLPKGGGALHGIGEKFSPDLYTGTGNFSVPLATPRDATAYSRSLPRPIAPAMAMGPSAWGGA